MSFLNFKLCGVISRKLTYAPDDQWCHLGTLPNCSCVIFGYVVPTIRCGLPAYGGEFFCIFVFYPLIPGSVLPCICLFIHLYFAVTSARVPGPGSGSIPCIPSALARMITGAVRDAQVAGRARQPGALQGTEADLTRCWQPCLNPYFSAYCEDYKYVKCLVNMAPRAVPCNCYHYSFIQRHELSAGFRDKCELWRSCCKHPDDQFSSKFCLKLGYALMRIWGNY